MHGLLMSIRLFKISENNLQLRNILFYIGLLEYVIDKGISSVLKNITLIYMLYKYEISLLFYADWITNIHKMRLSWDNKLF